MSDRLALVIREAVKAERSRRGMTQAELAAAIGIGYTQRIVYNIERGARVIALAETPELCAALGISLARLLIDADVKDIAKLGLDRKSP